MNYLLIDRDKFDDEVWQYETEFTQKGYNDWLKGAIENLQLIYDTYEAEGTVGENCGDVYILGDVINFLARTKIVTNKNYELVKKNKK